MNRLRDALETVAAEEKTLEVYAPDSAIVDELETQFSTRNVDVVHQPVPTGEVGGFAVVRDDTGVFVGALGLETLEAIVSPEITPPWDSGVSPIAFADLLSFLENTIFTSYDRRQLLAVAREIEERAWRVGTGRLIAGFQREAALEAQRSVYGRLARERALEVRCFVRENYPTDLEPAIDVVEAGGEIGRFWFVLFDGGDERTSGLLAEEREPGRYYGFWTDEPTRVREILTYLEETY